MELPNLEGRSVGVIGRLADERALKRRLRQQGATLTRALDESLALVVVGAKAKSKLGKAKRLGVPMIEAVALIAALEAAALEIPAQPQTRPKPPQGPSSPYELMLALKEVSRSSESLGPRIRAVLEAARKEGVAIDGLEPEEEADDESLLLIWCDDLDGCELYAVPIAELTQALHDDLRSIHGFCFADTSDGSAKQVGAALRVFYALGERDPDDFWAGWDLEPYAEVPAFGLQSSEDLLPLRGALTRYFRWRGQRIREVVSVNRAR
ncbi:MAG: hypothetical protein AAGE52_24910 [Myxococcota bacterium]